MSVCGRTDSRLVDVEDGDANASARPRIVFVAVGVGVDGGRGRQKGTREITERHQPMGCLCRLLWC